MKEGGREKASQQRADAGGRKGDGLWGWAEDRWHAVGGEAREIRWGPPGKALDEDTRSSDAILWPVGSH